MSAFEPSRGTVPSQRAVDAFLVAAVMAGERGKLAQLVRRWHRRLVAHAWRLTAGREAAEDAVQDAWADIVRGLGRLRDPDAFPAWAYRIVTRKCARSVRQTIHRRALESELARTSHALPPTPEDAAVRSLDEPKLRLAVRALPPDQRAAVALHYFEGLSIAETAIALDAPAGTVKTRLMHARRKLQIMLEGEDHG
jgi:RNA polymerase sigma-70 factor (ECF subfamily)